MNVAAASLVLLWSQIGAATQTPTVYDNTHNFPIGSRAVGMGGAYTALACDEAAVHYNVAALACAAHSRLELAANAYILQALSVPDAFGRGQDINALSYHALPSIVGGVRVLLDGDESGAGRLVFGMSVEMPNSVALTVDPAQPEKPNFLSVAVRDQITTGDLGLGYQIHRLFGIGLALGAVLRTYESRFSMLLTAREPVPCLPQNADSCFEYWTSTDERELTAVGGRAKLGLRLTPTERLSFGLMVSSPTLDIWGSASVAQVDATALQLVDDQNNVGHLFGPNVLRASGSSDVGLPARLALGAAYSAPRFTLSFDASLGFPRDTEEAYDLEQETVQGSIKLSRAELDRMASTVAIDFQPNFNLGAEFVMTDDVALGVGAFTDLSSVPANAEFADQVHMFGGSVALGLIGNQVRGWFGLSFEYGQSVTATLSDKFDLDTIWQKGFAYDDESTISRWTLAGIMGSSYSFFREKDESEPESQGEPKN